MADSDEIAAVAFDTNVFGERGVLDFSLIDRWCRLAKDEGLEIWLAESVVWEAAIHAAEVADELRAFLKRTAKILRRARIEVPMVPRYANPSELATGLIEQIEALELPVVVVSSDESDAIEAVKDQVLQRVPGRRGAGGDRTGAADSLFLRSIEAHAQLHNISYAVVSNDPDVVRALRTWRWDRPVYKSSRAAQQDLFLYTPAPEQAMVDLLRQLGERLASEDPNKALAGVDTHSLNVGRLFGETRAELVREIDVDVVAIGPVVGLCDVEIGRRSGWLRACALVRADLRVVVWYDTEIDGDVELVSDWVDVYDAVLELCLLCDVEDDEIRSFEVEDPAIVQLPYDAYSDDDEVLNDVCASFDYVYGLNGTEIFDALQASGQWNGTFLGKGLSIREYDHYEKDDDEHRTGIEMRIDSETARVYWVERPDGPEDVFELYADFDTAIPGYPSWSLSGRLLAVALGEDA